MHKSTSGLRRKRGEVTDFTPLSKRTVDKIPKSPPNTALRKKKVIVLITLPENPRRSRAASDSAVGLPQPESMPHLTDNPGYTRQASEGGQASTTSSFLETGASVSLTATHSEKLCLTYMLGLQAHDTIGFVFVHVYRSENMPCLRLAEFWERCLLVLLVLLLG